MFGKLFTNFYQNILAEFVFIKVPCSQHISLNTFRRIILKYKKSFFERHLILDVQTKFILQKPHCKTFYGNTLKIESCNSCLGFYFLIDRMGTFGFVHLFFACPIGCVEINLSRPANNFQRKKFNLKLL